MKAVFALVAAAAGFLRQEAVPAGCCHVCEYCCMSECLEKYQAEVDHEVNFVQVTKSKADGFMACLDKKAQCGETWTPERKQETAACLAAAAKGQSLLQTKVRDDCPESLSSGCQKRFAIGAVAAGMTMEQCTDACLKEHCGCPAS